MYNPPAPYFFSSPCSIFAEQEHEYGRLLADHRRLSALMPKLHLEIAAALHHLRHEEVAASLLEAERASEVRRLRERAAWLAAEVEVLAEVDRELGSVRAEEGKRAAEKRKLEEKRRVLKAELEAVRERGLEIRSVEMGINALNKEIQRGRKALQLEKKVRAENLEQHHAMECKFNSLSFEIQELQSELLDAKKRERACAAAADALQNEVAAFVKIVDGLGMECALDGGVISIKRKSGQSSGD